MNEFVKAFEHAARTEIEMTRRASRRKSMEGLLKKKPGTGRVIGSPKLTSREALLQAIKQKDKRPTDDGETSARGEELFVVALGRDGGDGGGDAGTGGNAGTEGNEDALGGEDVEVVVGLVSDRDGEEGGGGGGGNGGGMDRGALLAAIKGQSVDAGVEKKEEKKKRGKAKVKLGGGGPMDRNALLAALKGRHGGGSSEEDDDGGGEREGDETGLNVDVT